MTTIDEVRKSMRKNNIYFVPLQELNAYYFNMIFFSAWVGQPLLCCDQIRNQEVLAVVFIDDELGYCIKSLSGDLEGKKWTVSATILELKGKFDNWKEAKQWLSEPQPLSDDEFWQQMLTMEAQMDQAIFFPAAK